MIIWDPSTGAVAHRLEGHSRYVTCCVFSADNTLLATGSNDKQVIVWKLEKLGDIVVRRATQSVRVIDNNDSGDVLLSSANAVSTWTADSVASWINDLGLGEYEAVFKENEIDGQELLHLTHDTLLTALKIGMI